MQRYLHDLNCPKSDPRIYSYLTELMHPPLSSLYCSSWGRCLASSCVWAKGLEEIYNVYTQIMQFGLSLTKLEDGNRVPWDFLVSLKLIPFQQARLVLKGFFFRLCCCLNLLLIKILMK